MFKADFRLKTFDLEVLKELEKGPTTLVLDGVDLSVSKGPYKKLKTFQLSGTNCKGCGLQGQYLALEKIGSLWNLNLYGKKEGLEILFTRDHIIPLSKGGSDTFENSQTLCSPCNSFKANMTNKYFEEFKDIVKQERRLKKVLKKCEAHRRRHKERIDNLNSKKHSLESKLSFLKEVRKSLIEGPKDDKRL